MRVDLGAVDWTDPEARRAFSARAWYVFQGRAREAYLDPSHPLAPWAALFAAIEFLRRFGTPEELREAEELLERAWVEAHRLATLLEVEIPQEVPLVALATRAAVAAAERAEELLEAEGLRFSRARGYAEALPLPGSPGNRPKRLATSCILALWRHYRKTGPDGTPAELRERIRAELAGGLPPELIDAGPRGPIAKAIENLKGG